MNFDVPVPDARALEQQIRASINTAGMTRGFHGTHLVQGNSCAGCDYSGVNWTGRDLRGVKYTGVDFSKANLSGVNFSEARLAAADFSGANSSRSILP